MKGEKDDGKQMVPLFPGLHINDGNKGGPRAPPRNKISLFEEYNVASETSKIESRSRSMLPVPHSNGCSSFASHASSSNVVGAKRKLRPLLATMNECPHSAEWYYPHCSGGVSGPANYQNPSSSASSMMKAKCISVKPLRGFSSYGDCHTHNPGDVNDFAVPSFLQSGKTLNYRNLQLHFCKEKVATFSSASSSKCLSLPNETKGEDQTMEHHGNLDEESSELSQNNETVQPNWHKKNSSGDETSRSNFPYAQPYLKCKILQKSNTVADGMSTTSEKVTRKGAVSTIEHSSRSSPRVGDCNQSTKIDLIKKCSEDKDCMALKVGIAIIKEQVSDTSIEGSIPVLNLSTDEVVRVIGQRLFLKARKTMVHQQKIFSLQMFELHRLITVQRLVARSPEILHENNLHPCKPSIKFPPMNKLLYVSPLDTSPSPSVAKTKADNLRSNPGSDCGAEAIRGLLPLPTTNVEKGHLAQPINPKPLGPLTNPASMPIGPKLEPWCLPPPPGNQWLIPVRSPSEGLVYKPYPGPCFPTVGFMAPIYGNCGTISLSSSGGTTYGVPAPNEHGSGGFYGAELSQSYFQPYPMPLMNTCSSNHEIKPMIGVQVGEVDKSSFKVVSDCGGNLHISKEGERPGSEETSPPERLGGDALSLFPTTPSLQASKDQSDEQRVQVIKVVPHNRNSATASAARIFQSIQEERRKHE